MNVYEMYVEHGKKPGFWIRRNTWGNTCGRVVEVGELRGRPPYYGNPNVYADIFDLHSGELKEKRVLLSCAGNYSYTWIQPPSWSEESPVDPTAGKRLLFVPFGQNETARRIGAKWSKALGAWWIPESDSGALAKAESNGFLNKPPARLYFQVPYERRSIPQMYKAKWEARKKLWSVTEDKQDAIQAFLKAGFAHVNITNEDN